MKSSMNKKTVFNCSGVSEKRFTNLFLLHSSRFYVFEIVLVSLPSRLSPMNIKTAVPSNFYHSTANELSSKRPPATCHEHELKNHISFISSVLFKREWVKKSFETFQLYFRHTHIHTKKRET